MISINTVHNLDEQDCAKALQEIERVSKGKSFITVDAYRNNEEKDRMLKWNLTAKTIKHVDEWISFFQEVGCLEITTGLFHNLKTKAAVLVQVNEPLKVTELTIPSLEKGQVLVDMEWSGICRSQLMEVQGHREGNPYLPHLLGHEGAGRVIETGNEVSKLSKGDRVVVSWLREGA